MKENVSMIEVKRNEPARRDELPSDNKTCHFVEMIARIHVTTSAP